MLCIDLAINLVGTNLEGGPVSLWVVAPRLCCEPEMLMLILLVILGYIGIMENKMETTIVY